VEDTEKMDTQALKVTQAILEEDMEEMVLKEGMEKEGKMLSILDYCFRLILINSM
jgi:DNA primase